MTNWGVPRSELTRIAPAVGLANHYYVMVPLFSEKDYLTQWVGWTARSFHRDTTYAHTLKGVPAQS